MNIVTVDEITKAYGERKLFDKASFFLQEGEKAGIIGINGTGKSTLLKIIAGIEKPDSGNVILANHYTVQYLPQTPEFEPTDTVLQAVVRGTCHRGKPLDGRERSQNDDDEAWHYGF